MISDHGQKSECASILPVAMLAAPTAGAWFFSSMLDSGIFLSCIALISMPQAALPTGVETDFPFRSSSL
jgi:hypothetical protein